MSFKRSTPKSGTLKINKFKFALSDENKHLNVSDEFPSTSANKAEKNDVWAKKRWKVAAWRHHHVINKGTEKNYKKEIALKQAINWETSSLRSKSGI